MKHQIEHDLALAFAKISLQNAIRQGNIYDGSAPNNILEMDYFAEKYQSALDYYVNVVGIND